MARIPNYDAYITRLPPEPPVVRHCCHCHDEMREGDSAIQTWDGDVVHDECFYDYARDFLVFRRGYLMRDGAVE